MREWYRQWISFLFTIAFVICFSIPRLRTVFHVSLLSGLRTRLVIRNSCLDLLINFVPKRGHQLIDVFCWKQFTFLLWGVGSGARRRVSFSTWGYPKRIRCITWDWFWRFIWICWSMGSVRSFFKEIVLDFILVLIFLLRYLPIGYTKTLKNKVHSSANVVHNLKYLTLTELTEYNIEDLNIFISDKSLLPFSMQCKPISAVTCFQSFCRIFWLAPVLPVWRTTDFNEHYD